MKLILPILVFLVCGRDLFSQPIAVPFRAGNKFGLSTEAGKMIIPPQFDIVDPNFNDGDIFFKGYILGADKNTSNLVYKNKIILRDKPYNNYHLYGHLFTAVLYNPAPGSSRNNEETRDKYQLFNTDGKQLLTEDQWGVYVIEGLDPAYKLSEMLVSVTDMNKRSSLFVYNHKQKKIARTIIDKTIFKDEIYNYENDHNDQTISVVYKDAGGKGRKIKIAVKADQYKVIEDEPASLPGPSRDDERSSYDDVVVPREEPPPASRPGISPGETTSNDIRKVIIKRGPYYLQRKVEEITIKKELMKKDERYIVIKNGKQGLFNVYSNEYTIPVKYDEVLDAEFEGRHGGHILRNGEKYGAYIYSHPKNMTIEPVFDMIPLLEAFDYFGERAPLFKLYDATGKFFCFANQHGKLYYQAAGVKK